VRAGTHEVVRPKKAATARARAKLTERRTKFKAGDLGQARRGIRNGGERRFGDSIVKDDGR